MENTNRILSSRKKENIPPRLSSYLKSEHRNVQKNVNENLYLGAGSQAEATHHRASVAAFTVTRGWEGEHGTTTSAGESRDPKKRDPSLIQTNLSFRAATSWLSNPCSQQQNNLCCRLQQRGSEKVAYGKPPLPSSAQPNVALQQRRSCFNTAGLEGKGEKVSASLAERSLQCKRKPKEGSSLRDQSSVHCTYYHLPERRDQSNEQQVKKQHGPLAAYDADHGNPLLVSTDSLSPTVVPVIASAGLVPHSRPMGCPSSGCSRGSVNSCCLGPTLTLDELGPSSLAESHPSSASLQSLLQSSKTSASLHCSIQRLKQEAALMGIWNSHPLVSSSSPVACSLCFAPEVCAPAVLSVREQLAREQSSAKQARMKWGTPFARDWGLGSVAGDLGDAKLTSLCHKCRNIELYVQKTKVSDGIWPETPCAGTSSVYLVSTEAGSPYDCSAYLRRKSQAQQDGMYGHIKALFPEKPLEAEESFARKPPCSMHWRKAFPSSPDPDGLQVSMETQEDGAPMNVSIAVYGAPTEVHVRLQSPSGDAGIGQVQQFHMGSIDVGASEPPGRDHGESAEACNIISSAARRIAVVNTRQSVPSPSDSPFRVTVRQGPSEYSVVATDIDGTKATQEGGNEECYQKAFCGHQELSIDQDQSEKLPAEQSSKELQHSEESIQEQDVIPVGGPERNFLHLEMERSFQLLCNKRQLARCFQAWSSQALGKMTAARELYKRQLLRKGLGALRWAVQLRKVQVEIAQRRCSLVVLAFSFHRWKQAVVKQNKSQTSLQALTPLAKELPGGLVGLGRDPAVTAPRWCQLSAGSPQGAAQHSRMEADLWLQLHRRQGADKLCQRAQAIRDLRRLAAAFRLWCLQKELLNKEEARVREARALLEKKQLRNIFQVWHSRSLETERILPLMTRIRRELATRCFNAWRQFVEQKTLCRHSLDHHRAGSLRKCFQQWVQMLQLREVDKMTMVNLFTLRQRRCYGRPATSAAGGPVVKEDEVLPYSTVMRWFLRKGGGSLDDLCRRMKLQRIFLLWKVRHSQQQQANSFSQDLEQRRLRDVLKQWHQKTLNHNPRAPPEEPFALLDSEESSLSSGFHSSTLAFASLCSLEKESSLHDSSWNSLSSLLTTEDTTHLSRYVCCLQQHHCPEIPAELLGELSLVVCPSSQSPPVGGNRCMGGQLRASALWRPGSDPLPSYSAWEEMRFQSDALQGDGSGDELESSSSSLWCQAEQQFLQRYFVVWSAQTQQHLKIKRHCRLVLLSRAFLGWHKWVVEDKNWKAMASQHYCLHCCRAAFDLWKQRLTQKVEADRRFRHRLHQKAADALRYWQTCWQKQCSLRDLQLQWAQHSSQERKRTIMQAWCCQAAKGRSATLCWERLLLRRVLVAWLQVTIRGAKQHEALAQLELARQQRLLMLCFARWRTEFLRAEKWQQEERDCKQRPAWAKSFQRWRVATRGHQALHLNSMAVVKQACNYWTKAATLSQSSRQQCALIGARKCRKMPLSWSIKSRRYREKGLGPSLTTYHRLLPSSFRRWLAIYRNQSRLEQLPVHPLLEMPGTVGWASGQSWPQDSSTDEQDRKWLGTKYLNRWRRNVLLRRFQDSRRACSLERWWLQWKGASCMALMVQAVIGQRLLAWGWRIWRRRYLQSQVSQSFLEGEDRSLLSRAFGRWHQLTMSCMESGGPQSHWRNCPKPNSDHSWLLK